VYIASRSRSRVQAAITELHHTTGREAIFLEVDLADLSSVRRAATKFHELEPDLHTLFNNAGVMNCPVDQLTKDGYDMQWGTNVVVGRCLPNEYGILSDHLQCIGTLAIHAASHACPRARSTLFSR
jgi:NAD(P)-dependent dehydrogenase (short-subunit alcohol dehydrogenase family)